MQLPFGLPFAVFLICLLQAYCGKQVAVVFCERALVRLAAVSAASPHGVICVCAYNDRVSGLGICYGWLLL